mgnify:CR=1 FL=1
MTDSNHFKDWDLSHWAYLNGKPAVSAEFKSEPEDFIVTEQLGFELTGEGENLFLLIEKRQLNTQQVCEYLAKFFGKRLRDIGYAGLKDKQSISRQWFSVQMNVKQSPDLSNLGNESIKLLQHKRHGKKLKVGVLAANRFDIRLKNVSDLEELESRLTKVKEFGAPNYFGGQRFGFKGNNLNWANRMASGEQIRDKKIKGFAISAARSFLFNEVVSRRLAQNKFVTPLTGEVYLLAGSNSFFSQPLDDEILKRLMEKDILLSAALFGKGELATAEEALELENEVVSEHENWLELLEQQGLKQERRAVRVSPEKMEWQQEGNDMLVSFELPAGCFATSVLRECANID